MSLTKGNQTLTLTGLRFNASLGVLDHEIDRGRTIIATTHDLACAAQRFHDVIALAGRVVTHGKAQLVLDREVARVVQIERTRGVVLQPERLARTAENRW